MASNTKIFVAGHRGMVGSAVVRELTKNGYDNIITRTHDQLDLTKQQSVQTFFENEKPEYVILAAAKVGGIFANSQFPADFIYTNLMIQSNVIHQAYKAKVKQLLFLGSSCIYPKYSNQPIREDSLLSGPLEPTNEPYAIAKIAGLKLCESYNRQYGTDFRSLMPTNLYGPNDDYDLTNSHVIPALIRKIHLAKITNNKTLSVWGTGSARREFLHVDDLANACLTIMGIDKTRYWEEGLGPNNHINIGTGKDISIAHLVNLLKETISYTGEICWDSSKPDGAPQKLLDISKATRLGWRASIGLKQGLADTYQNHLNTL